MICCAARYCHAVWYGVWGVVWCGMCGVAGRGVVCFGVVW